MCNPNNPLLVTNSRLAVIKMSSADLQCISCCAANCKSELPHGAVGGFVHVDDSGSRAGREGKKRDAAR